MLRWCIIASMLFEVGANEVGTSTLQEGLPRKTSKLRRMETQESSRAAENDLEEWVNSELYR